MTQIPDFRNDLTAATARMTDVMSAVRPEQYADPTPCAEYDVKALLEHIACHPHKLTAMATGEDRREVPGSYPIGERPAEDYAKNMAEALSLWSDDDLLGATVIAPWGETAGGIALAGDLLEVVAHGWDLAVSTGQPSEADPKLVGKVQGFVANLPFDNFRGPGMPFGPEVEAAPDAGPTVQLAAFLGRHWVAS